MRPTPKHIDKPELKSAVKLTPLQLNAIKPDVRHTILTPEQLDEMARQQNDNQS